MDPDKSILFNKVGQCGEWYRELSLGRKTFLEIYGRAIGNQV